MLLKCPTLDTKESVSQHQSLSSRNYQHDLCRSSLMKKKQSLSRFENIEADSLSPFDPKAVSISMENSHFQDYDSPSPTHSKAVSTSMKNSHFLGYEGWHKIHKPQSTQQFLVAVVEFKPTPPKRLVLQASQEETKNGLKQRMMKGHQEIQKCQEDLRSTLEKKIDCVERIAVKMEEKIKVVEDKMEEKIIEGKLMKGLKKWLYCMGRLKDAVIQRTLRMTDVQDLKSALKLDVTIQASHRDCHSIQELRVALDAHGEFSCMKAIIKPREEILDFGLNVRIRGNTASSVVGVGK
ncbi:hypothetical protein TNCV_4894532 [Trichonephila clavipes]|nr:hypothetical protein TNCV_4894532 [Trichonephila clavipes]